MPIFESFSASGRGCAGEGEGMLTMDGGASGQNPSPELSSCKTRLPSERRWHCGAVSPLELSESKTSAFNKWVFTCDGVRNRKFKRAAFILETQVEPDLCTRAAGKFRCHFKHPTTPELKEHTQYCLHAFSRRPRV